MIYDKRQNADRRFVLSKKRKEDIIMAIAGSLIASIFMGVLIPLAVIAMVIFLAIWTYRDATNKGYEPCYR